MTKKATESHVEEVQDKLLSLTKQNTQLENEVAYLKEQVAWFERQVFGQRSEKLVKDLDETDSNIFPEFKEWFERQSQDDQEVKKKTVEAHTRRVPRRTGKDRITYPADLPVKRIELDLPEEEKVCPETGKPYVKIGEEISQKLAHKPSVIT